jgi:hypothetical protein
MENQTSPRYLTKSRFKLALECPTKLYYTKKKEYPDQKLDNAFLQALANGGFQVGELAKCYFPGGHDIVDLDYQTSLAKTNELLKLDSVIIYEAAFLYKNLFMRADIVVKKQNKIFLYEVKAKSVDGTNPSFLTKKETIETRWKPYLYDIAFQKYVLQNAFSSLIVEAYLILADKSAKASVDGLNQKFFLGTDNHGRTKVDIIGDVSEAGLGDHILCIVPVDHIVDPLLKHTPFADIPEKSFIEWISFYADNYSQDNLIRTAIKASCRDCEFKSLFNAEPGNLSGFNECWKREVGFKDFDFTKPSVLNIWDSRTKDKFISEGRYFQAELVDEDLIPKKSVMKDGAGLSRLQRQILQITKSRDNDNSDYLDLEGLADVFETFIYPLHFIDFETSAVAIPFNKGRKPYEQTAFQFSHHIVHEDGTIEHKGEWLDYKVGVFPNFDFLRALKVELSLDSGTIFRYAAHENSILNAIYRQLKESNEVDKIELCLWIQEITKSSSSTTDKWEGKRNMVDLRELVLKYYYSPSTNGSNSVKEILPAILNSSDYLKDKYSKPVYGTVIKSLNFTNHTWIDYDDFGKVINPYKKLEPLFKDVDQDLLDSLISDEDIEIADGGAAMTAYARMQFTQMGNEERMLIQKSLLKYCELDTLAMVMIYEHWKNKISSQ